LAYDWLAQDVDGCDEKVSFGWPFLWPIARAALLQFAAAICYTPRHFSYRL